MAAEGERSESPGTWLGVLGHALAAALGVGGACALVDLGQVALRYPGQLPRAGVPLLLGLYLVPSALAAFVLLAAVKLRRPARVGAAVAGVQALLVAGWAFFLIQGTVLRRLPSLSPWRTALVVALALGAVAAVRPLGRALRRVRVGAIATALLWALVAAGAVGAVRGFGPPPRAGTLPVARERVEPGPNMILVTIDSLRADHLSCYGYPRPTTPTIDRLASEAVLFAQAYAQSSWTKPSTASLLTSHYPSMHQTNLENARLSDAEVLLPEVLRAHGYATAVLSANPWVTTEYGFNQGVDHFYALYEERFARVTLFMAGLKRASLLLRVPAYNLVKRLIQPELSTTARDEVLAAEGTRWLAAQRGRPFFMYIHMMSPHYPYDPPPPYDRAFVTHPVQPPIVNHPHKSYFFGEGGDPLSPEQLADMVGRYDGDIRFADTVIEKLLAALRRLDLLDRTVLVLTADHGEEFYDHGNWGHGHSVYNELLHVPLIVRYPGRFPGGTRVDTPVMAVDVMPTLLELAGVPPASAMAGSSLVALAEGRPSAEPGEAFAELLYRYGSGRALVQGDKKLLEFTVGEDRRREMYDLGADPEEKWNLANELTQTARYASRLAEVQSWAEQHRVEAAEVSDTAELKTRVRAHGYVN